jgi:predicted ATPase
LNRKEIDWMKTALQIRAENAAVCFHGASKPVIFEFAGVPGAGKTSTLHALQTFLQRCGFRVETVPDRTSLCPIRDKAHSDFDVWAACATLAQILERAHQPPRPDDPDILILDRGLFDALCWLRLMERLERIRPAERQAIESFLRMAGWRRRISAVFVMLASPGDARQRENELLPAEHREGSIMNEPVLARMLQATRDTARSLKQEFRIFEIDTSTGRKDGPKRVAEMVAQLALTVIEEHRLEEVLSLPKAEVTRRFAGKRCLNAAEAATLARSFAKSGSYGPGEAVETNQIRFQAFPVVVVRNPTGRVLRLRRKEPAGPNPPHETLVIWTGGPVRKEDQAGGDPALNCALRAVQTELRFSPEPHALKLRGAVCCEPDGGDAQQRVAIVYEWKVKTDAVATVLTRAEWFDRRGAAVKGTFVRLRDLAREVDDGKFTDALSGEIVRELLARDYRFSPRLF